MQPQGGQKRQAASGSEGQQVQLTFGTGAPKVQSDAPLKEEDIYGLEDAPEGMVSMPLGGEEDF